MAPKNRHDGWENIGTGLGVSGFDKRLQATSTLIVIPEAEAEVLWRSNDMAAKAIEIYPYEETRAGFKIEANGQDSALDEIHTLLEDMDVLGSIYTARCYARAYGGGAILLGADDGNRDLSQPLEVERVRAFEWMNVLHPQELAPHTWYGDPSAPKYGEVETYLLSPDSASGQNSGTTIVHETRLIRFEGFVASRQHRRQSRGWGDSVLNRVYETIRDFDSTWDGTAALMNDFAQTIFKMRGLHELVSSEDPEDQQRFRRRVAALDYSRSVVNSVLLDSEGEDFERKTTSIAGLPDVLDRFAKRLASALDVPVTRLFGDSPGGLSATGGADIQFFYDKVVARQHKELKKPLQRIVTLLAQANGIKLPENWKICFNDLTQLTEMEEATRRKTVIEGAKMAVDAGMITPEEAAVSLFGSGHFEDDIKLLTEDRSSVEPPEPEPMPGGFPK